MQKKIITSLMILGLCLAFSCNPDSNDGVTPVCDDSIITLSGVIKPILNGNCITCHSGPTPAGGLDFGKYSDLLIVANDGRLVGSINRKPGFTPMPQSASKLPMCDIMKIEKWVSDGAPNN